MKRIYLYTILIYSSLTSQSSKLKELTDQVKIKSFSYQGSGCPNGSVFVDISPDKEVFTTSFNQFIVSKDGAKEPSENQKTVY